MDIHGFIEDTNITCIITAKHTILQRQHCSKTRKRTTVYIVPGSGHTLPFS